MKREIPSAPCASRVVAPSGFVIRHSFIRHFQHGAAMLATLMFALAGTIVITAWISLLGARLQQSERMSVEVQRHTVWGNTRAINQQYAFTWAMRDNVTRSSSSATLSGWGGSVADAFSALEAFRSTVRPSNTSGTSYPFNNIRKFPTSDSGVYFARTTADSDSSQAEHLTFYNYLKTYPSSLLGDLLIFHKKPVTATGSYTMTDNLQVNGRVIIWDETLDAINIRAESCLNMTKTGTNTVKNTAATPVNMLPQNFPASVTTTAGYGGTASPFAITNGTLDLANNTDFTAGSVRHTIETTGSAGVTWMNCTTSWSSSTNIDTDSSNGTSTSSTQTVLDTSPDYPPPTASPYGYSAGTTMNMFIVRLKNSSLRHLRITSGVEQLILEGQTNTTDYNAAGLLPPVIIWLERPDCRDIRFVGENNRRLILVTGPGSGATLYASWHGNSLVGGSPNRWRLNWINEHRAIYLNAPTGNGVLITGGMRTNWTIGCTDGGSSVRFTFQRETSPGTLETLLPRDGWLEPYALVR